MNLLDFNTREEASAAAAQQIVAALQNRLQQQPKTQLVVTGGSSPASCYQVLSATEIAWQNVQILLSDERWIPADHPDSNERLLRETLLIDKAAAAEFLPFYSADMSSSERSDHVSRIIGGFETPSACTLLGMGGDGHIASLFPDAGNLQTGLTANSPIYCIPINTIASPYQRISLTLSALLKSDEVALLIFGEEKRVVVEQACKSVGDFPVASLLNQSQVPVNVFWAP